MSNRERVFCSRNDRLFPRAAEKETLQHISPDNAPAACVICLISVQSYRWRDGTPKYQIDQSHTAPSDQRHLRGVTRKNTLVSLFSGAGGLDLGFKKAGFRTIWANEYDSAIWDTYRKNFPRVKLDKRSINDIPDSDIPRATGVIGGPPCQSWSEAGARRGINDPRGALFKQYCRVIERVHPLFFVAENVRGLLFDRNSGPFEKIKEQLLESGYVVVHKLLNAKDYGVPQDRKRVFIVGYHKSLRKKFGFPKPRVESDVLRDAIWDLRRLSPTGSKKVPNNEMTINGFSPIFMSRNRVRSWEEPSYTILACDRHIPLHPQAPKMERINGSEMRRFVPGQEERYRRLTIRECARIQTFPDKFEFMYKHIRDGYKMVGNAVPVQMAEIIASQILRDLKGSKMPGSR